MSPAEIEALIAHWRDSELEESEDYRAVHLVTDDYLEGVQMVLSTQFDETCCAPLKIWTGSLVRWVQETH